MLLSKHFIVSVILAAILFPFFGIDSLMVLTSGFFIDFDHLIFYWMKFKRNDIKNAYNYFRDIALKKDVKEYKTGVRIFHSVEFITLIIILSFYHKIFALLLIGLITHITMDIIYEYSNFKTLSGFSLIEYIIKNVKKHFKK